MLDEGEMMLKEGASSLKGVRPSHHHRPGQISDTVLKASKITRTCAKIDPHRSCYCRSHLKPRGYISVEEYVYRGMLWP
jgi:hypothetical protein